MKKEKMTMSEGNVNIIRHDRGLDSKRIENIIKMITDAVNDIKYDRRDILKDKKKELKAKYIEDHDLQKEFDAIAHYDKVIEELEQKINEAKDLQRPHKLAISRHTRAEEETYMYQDVRNGSKIQAYYDEHLPNIDDIKGNLDQILAESTNELWLAEDIGQAKQIYQRAIEYINHITEPIK